MKTEIRDRLKYTQEHEWVTLPDEKGICLVGITDYAQSELGDIVYVDVETEGEILKKDEAFGTIEAVKVVTNIFLPTDCEILELNINVEEEPELLNTSPYDDGWIIKIKVKDINFHTQLLTYEEYSNLINNI